MDPGQGETRCQHAGRPKPLSPRSGLYGSAEGALDERWKVVGRSMEGSRTTPEQHQTMRLSLPARGQLERGWHVKQLSEKPYHTRGYWVWYGSDTAGHKIVIFHDRFCG